MYESPPALVKLVVSANVDRTSVDVSSGTGVAIVEQSGRDTRDPAAGQVVS